MTPHPPKWFPGDPKGEWTVQANLGRSQTNLVTGHYMAKPQHYYRVECACGNVEILNQAQLNARDRCLECSALAKAEKLSEWALARNQDKTAVPDPDAPPDFARMKLP